MPVWSNLVPHYVTVTLLVIFIVATINLIVVPLLVSWLRMTRSGMKAAQQSEARSGEFLATLLGCLVVDFVFYYVYRSTLPKAFFYGALLIINALCLIIALYATLVSRLQKKHVSEPAAQSLREAEVAVE